MMDKAFIVDCPECRAKVAATLSGSAHKSGVDEHNGEPYAERLLVGHCPSCKSLLAGWTYQIAFENIDSEFDHWSSVVRIYPKPSRTFSSYRIPETLTKSLWEADRCLQADASTAACAMFGRALESLCQDVLEGGEKEPEPDGNRPRRKIMLGEGIKRLKDEGHIDQRLYDWSQDLRAFRNIAAHADERTISRMDAEDLQTFVYAIVEYIYDLADRYNEFKRRSAAAAK